VAKLADMRSGDLRQVVTLQSPPDGVGSRGERTGEWSAVATIRAKVEALSGEEVIQANQLVAMATHRVTIRFRTNVTPLQRLRFGTRYLNIGFVNNLQERNRWIELLCKEDI